MNIILVMTINSCFTFCNVTVSSSKSSDYNLVEKYSGDVFDLCCRYLGVSMAEGEMT